MVYLKEYTRLTPQEKRQYNYKRMFKKEFPLWDDTQILLIRLVDQFAKKGFRVLDAGCGNGNIVIDELREKIGFAVGIDADKSATLKNTCLDKIIIAPLDKIPLPSNSFDAVVSLWVLEHLEDPEKVFKEIKRVLKPGGIFAFATPNKKNFLIAAKNFISPLNESIVDTLIHALYGRAHEDIFKTYYKANTIKDIAHLSQKIGFKTEYLAENFDPSYTSFNILTYLFTKGTYFLNLSPFKTHIAGVLRK